MSIYAVGNQQPPRGVGFWPFTSSEKPGASGIAKTPCEKIESFLSAEANRLYIRPAPPPPMMDPAFNCKQAAASARRLSLALNDIKRITKTGGSYHQRAAEEIRRAQELINSMTDRYEAQRHLDHVASLLADRLWCVENIADPECFGIMQHQQDAADKLKEETDKTAKELQEAAAAENKRLRKEKGKECRAQCELENGGYAFCTALYYTGNACAYQDFMKYKKYVIYGGAVIAVGVGLWLVRPLLSIALETIKR